MGEDELIGSIEVVNADHFHGGSGHLGFDDGGSRSGDFVDDLGGLLTVGHSPGAFEGLEDRKRLLGRSRGDGDGGEKQRGSDQHITQYNFVVELAIVERLLVV